MENALFTAIRQQLPDSLLEKVYAGKPDTAQRIENACARFASLFPGARGARVFSVPGRTELAGNHQDHNGGKVIAAAVELDILAIAVPINEPEARYYSEGVGEFSAPLRAEGPLPQDARSSQGLVRGVCAALRSRGYRTGGFCAYIHSQVPRGSGLSSSAAFEVLIALLQSELFNGGSVPPVVMAQCAQYAENVYYKKPCGLMDQLACAVGGVIAIDFSGSEPQITSLPPPQAEYTLCILDAGGNHAGLDADYGAIPAEMKKCAAFFGFERMREVPPALLYANLPALRAACGDRAALRALHFSDELARVQAQTEALQKGDMLRFTALANASGLSSWHCLQNVAGPDPREQSLALALYAASRALKGKGACRVHGGGFAGTAAVFVPAGQEENFKTELESALGTGCCHFLRLLPRGAMELTKA